MEQQISIIRRKMMFVVCILFALGAWQHAFIMEGVMAHVQINLTILGTGAFGVISAFVFVSKLSNEVVAFRALKEMWDDTRRPPDQVARNPNWLYARCAEPAQTFSRPRLLGHAYDLVTDELALSKNIRVSLETMNTLVHKIEASINDEKSLIVYISGLLVFMGLIGTFIGLLHMVNAIGGIIGSLAKSGDAAASAGAFTQLLGALEAPLHGMAAGFASSLFGLFCSLLVGLMGRFAGQAAGVLKAHFEAWLAGVVELSDDDHREPLTEGGTVTDATVLKLVAGLLGDYGRIAGSFDAAASRLSEIQKTQSGQAEALARVFTELDRARAVQTQVLDTLAAQPPLKGALDDFALRLEASVDRLRAVRESEGLHMREALDALGRANSHDIRALAARQSEGPAQIVAGLAEASATLDKLAAAASPARIEAAIELGLGKAWGEAGKAVRLAAKGVGDQIDNGVASLRRDQDRQSQALLSALGERAAQASGETLRGVEAALGDGLQRIGHSVDAALTAYASLARVAMAALERTRPAEPSRSEAPASDLSGAA